MDTELHQKAVPKASANPWVLDGNHLPGFNEKTPVGKDRKLVFRDFLDGNQDGNMLKVE